MEKDQIIRERIDHSGIFDFPALYSYMSTWYKDELFGVVEEKYSETVSANGRNISIEWKATKTISDYFKFQHEIKIEITNLSDVEVEIEGKKKKMNKGKIWMEIKGILLKDYENRWDATPIWRFTRDVYNKYIIRGRIEFLEEKIMLDVRTFKDSVKAFMELSGKRPAS